jgi:hypothetical protein
MVKDGKKYASTGGWSFQVWAGGDPSATPRNPASLAILHKKPRTSHFQPTFPKAAVALPLAGDVLRSPNRLV